MLLAVDIGNSNVKFALYEGEKLRAFFHCTTLHKRTADEYAGFLTQALALQRVPLWEVTAAIVSSVVPEATPHIVQGIDTLFMIKTRQIAGAEDLPVKCLVDRPQDAGSDRLIAIMAARSLHKTPLLIVDFGTATTFTAVNAEGSYCGGAIAPGVNISLTALYVSAAKLPKVELKPPPDVLAKSTIHAMQSGVYYGSISMVEGMIARLRKSFGDFASVVASGGLSTLFDGQIAGITATNPYLNLTGLRLAYETLKDKSI